ncbi:MAG: 5'/3'-nucleotidase SurE [Methanobrevibacter sp.]|uniref:5'/3'-nucleotidase SurE n=1 Tax=Methanobrevibacter TaxID=2172 RepID=UPI002579B49A|nr:5'/3'-nucleotidase SurE [Methanobrevibacter sp.]MBR2664944.1 5'/3'-nucleotidase SurE [Methanobrevibacter sp.]MBR3197304.1 5'/3'-nucleotidase SurE [Methanobrevibacter sp.]MBR7049841.1 5'/3'-nucleotidase SurE [Methanobrevibacter sp.]
MNILISNDDGVFAPGILAAKQAVEDLANVTVVAPDENNSSVGRRMTLFKHLEIKTVELEDGSEAYSVSGSPADAVIVGAEYVMDDKPDLVITGINQGVNISCDITSSGTVCAAFEAVSLGIPAIAASLFMDPKTSYKQDENGEWYLDYDFSLAKRVLHDIVLKIINEGFPDGVDLFNLNVPSNYESEDVKITRLSDKMIDKKVIDNTNEEKAELFNYPLQENQNSDDLIMIAPDLVSEYDEGSDGYALMIEKRPSLTPLKVNMTSEDLKDW